MTRLVHGPTVTRIAILAGVSMATQSETGNTANHVDNPGAAIAQHPASATKAI